MTEHDEVLRIVISTDRVWRADVLADCLSALDGLVTRIVAACQVSELLRRYNEELEGIQAMGLLAPGSTPEQWGKAERGTDALTREGYLKAASALRRHGIVVRQEHLGWAVDFEFDDIVQIAPRAQHLEIEFIHMASPGGASFVQTGSKVLKDADGFIRHAFDRWTEPELSRRLMEAHVKIKENEARIAQEGANQAAMKTQMLEAVVDTFQKQCESSAPTPRQTALDAAQRFDGLRGALVAGGLSLQKADETVLRPIEERINRLARFVCDEFITGIASGVYPSTDAGPESK